jgi:hypothetical protein
MTASDLADRHAIERLLYEYAFRLDSGQFEQFAELFRDGVWLDYHGYEAVLSWVNANIYRYDGIPLTQHVVSNVSINFDGDSARALSYLTVVQRSPEGGRLDVITVVCYEDIFVRTDQGWAFRLRRPARRMAGDNSRHRRPATSATSAPAPSGEELGLADRLALRSLVDQYAVAADNRDGDAIAALFAPDGVLQIFDRGDLTVAPLEVRDTPAALAAGPKRLNRYLATSHFVGQHVVTVAKSGVSAITYCVANHLYAVDGRVANFAVHVRYLDDYVQCDGQWRFALRRVVFDFVEHRPAGGSIL